MRSGEIHAQVGMHSTMRRLRPLLSALSAAALLLLAGCGVAEESLAGVWEGRSPDTTYVFSLHADGAVRVRIVTKGRTADYACSWSVAGDRLRLNRERGASTSFKIMDQSADEMSLRVGGGSGGVCRLRRVSLR